MLTVSQQGGTRPADHRIAMAHPRGLTPRQIGEHLTLPTEYVERRLPLVVDMPVVVPPVRDNLENRLLTVLRDADRAPVRLIDLLGVYPEGHEGSMGSIKGKISALRKRGFVISHWVYNEMLEAPCLEPTSRVMAGMVARLRQGRATTDELAIAGGIPVDQTRRYMSMIRDRGGEVAVYRMYVLENPEHQS